MSPTIRHNDALVTGEAERPRNARVWDRHVEYDDEPVREPVREPAQDAQQRLDERGHRAQPPARVEPARPPLREAPPAPAPADARAAARPSRHRPSIRRVEPRAAPTRAARTSRTSRTSRTTRAVSIGRVLDQLSGIRSTRSPTRSQPIPFGITPDVWACLSADTQRSFRALARRLRAVLR